MGRTKKNLGYENLFKVILDKTSQNAEVTMENITELYNVTKQDFKNQSDKANKEIKSLERKLNAKDKLIKKWQAMFTAQALANAKLINKETDYD